MKRGTRYATDGKTYTCWPVLGYCARRRIPFLFEPFKMPRPRFGQLGRITKHTAFAERRRVCEHMYGPVTLIRPCRFSGAIVRACIDKLAYLP